MAETIPNGTHTIRVGKTKITFTTTSNVMIPERRLLWDYLNRMADQGIATPTAAHVTAFQASLPEWISWDWNNLAGITTIVRVTLP